MQNYGILCLFRSKLAITHTIAIEWREKYDAIAVDCHQVLYLCVGRMKMSLPKKKIFFFWGGGGGGGGETPNSPGSHIGQKIWPLGRLFRPSRHLAYSLD